MKIIFNSLIINCLIYFIIVLFFSKIAHAESDSKILAINIDKAGKKIVIGDSEGKITVFDRFTIEKQYSFPLNENMNEIVFLKSGLIVSHGSRLSQITWGAAQFISIKNQITTVDGSVTNLRISNDEKFISAINTEVNKPYLVEIASSGLVTNSVNITENISIGVMHPDQQILFMGTLKGSVIIYDIEKSKIIQKKSLFSVPIKDIAFLKDGSFVIAGRKSASIYNISKSWNFAKTASITHDQAIEGHISVFPSEEGDHIVISTTDLEILWEPTNKSTKINKIRGLFPSLCSSDVSTCIKQTGNRTILIFDIPDYREIKTFDIPQ